MLKLTYCYKRDMHTSVTVIGSPHGIRDLYWQLTKNYDAKDGTAIGKIKVTNLDGLEIDSSELMHQPYSNSTMMDRGSV